MSLDNESFRDATARIRRAQSVVVTGHTHPDGDSVGSMLGLGLGLESLGKQVHYVSSDGVPGKYGKLPGADRVVRKLEHDVDLGMAVDCSTPAMMGESSGIPEHTRAIIGVDHHQFRKPFSFELVDKDAAAVGEIVYLLLWAMRAPITKSVAENLLTSIIVETNSFRLPKVRPFTFSLCAELLKTGVNFRALVNTVFWARSKPSVLLLGKCLERASFSRHGLLMWSVLKKTDLARARGTDEDADPIIEEMRSITGVEVSILFRQQKHGFRVSFRSRGKINVGKLAEHFGGGGHFDAAGAMIPATRRAMNAVITIALTGLREA